MEKRVEQEARPPFNNFRINRDGRPEGTCETTEGVVHYTCNSPEDEVLEQFGIKPIGKKFVENGLCKEGLANNEVLLIPYKVFEDKGMKVGTIEAETVLAKLSQTKSDN